MSDNKEKIFITEDEYKMKKIRTQLILNNKLKDRLPKKNKITRKSSK